MKFRCLSIMAASLVLASCATLPRSAAAPAFYGEEYFAAVPKMDAHVHINIYDPAFLKLARDRGFAVLSINVDYPDFPALAEQAGVARRMKAAEPRLFDYATTFPMDGFGGAGRMGRGCCFAAKLDAIPSRALGGVERAVGDPIELLETVGPRRFGDADAGGHRMIADRRAMVARRDLAPHAFRELPFVGIVRGDA